MKVGQITLAAGIVFMLMILAIIFLLPRPKSTDSEEQWILPYHTEQIPDFRSITDVNHKKQAFFGFLAPLVNRANALVLLDRQFVEQKIAEFQSGQTITAVDIKRLATIAKEYDIDFVEVSDSVFEQLLYRVDEIPIDMFLIQAANETGWGTSRFAVEGKNYFGQWCFSRGCGLVPSSRTAGLEHEVAKFATVFASVQSYLNNLNTNSAYRGLRAIRAQQRAAGVALNTYELIQGLIHYSERKQAYIDELRQMLKYNQKFIDATKDQNVSNPVAATN
ncbi:glucosaminidase domain-containing protein [Paraferrimonas sp. SM1919]|uniref:glucosaminidase domain-containing protein n=1 Tax=Paraferrimonas sp. SM1919 TaxID=2662263 RepID=UPI001F09E480|nr:glucosaminidase domain-containing protein [Paraferrimonas sp. SM1919]